MTSIFFHQESIPVVPSYILAVVFKFGVLFIFGPFLPQGERERERERAVGDLRGMSRSREGGEA